MMNVRLMTVLMAVGVCAVVQSMAQDKGPNDQRTPIVQEAHENYTIQLHGGYMESAPLDLLLTGSGPEFKIELGDPRASFHATLKPSVETVEIKYDLVFVVMITKGVTPGVVGPASQVQQVSNVEQRSSGVIGSAVLEYGKPLAIVTLNQKKLELTVTRSKVAKE